MKFSGVKTKLGYIILAVFALLLFGILPQIVRLGAYTIMTDVFKLSPQSFASIQIQIDIAVNFMLLVIFFYISNKLTKDDEKPRTLEKSKIIDSIVLGLGVSGISLVWLWIAEKIPFFKDSIEAMNKMTDSMNSMELIILACIIGPILEELVFRGTILNSIKKIKNGWIPILVSALVFGYAHGLPVQMVYTFIMGIVAGILYLKTGNIIYPIILHVVNNLVSATSSMANHNISNILDSFTIIMIIPLCIIMFNMLKKPIIDKL